MSAPNVIVQVNMPVFKYQAQHVVAICDNKMWLDNRKKVRKVKHNCDFPLQTDEN